MDHAQIIAALGGYHEIARVLGLAPQVVWRWGVTRAIPPRRWPWCVEYARQQGIAGVTLDDLAAGYYPEHQAAQAERSRLAALQAAAAIP